MAEKQELYYKAYGKDIYFNRVRVIRYFILIALITIQPYSCTRAIYNVTDTEKTDANLDTNLDQFVIDKGSDLVQDASTDTSRDVSTADQSIDQKQDLTPPSGTALSVKSFTGDNHIYGQSIAVDKLGNIALFGSFLGSFDPGDGTVSSVGSFDIFLAYYNSSKQLLWTKHFGNTNTDFGDSVEFDDQGNLYISGSFRGSVDFGNGTTTATLGDDAFLASYDSVGNFRWLKTYGSTGASSSGIARARSIAVNSSGTIASTGNFGNTVDFGDGAEVATSSDVYISTLASNQSLLWAKTFGGPSSNTAYQIDIDNSGNVVFAGTFHETIDLGTGPLPSPGSTTGIFVASYNNLGNVRWAKTFSGPDGPDETRSVVFDNNGNAILCAYFHGTIDFGTGPLTTQDPSYSDLVIASFDSTGKALFAKNYGNGNSNLAEKCIVDQSGNITTVGWFYDTADFGTGPLISAGGSDIFVAHFDSNGNPIWSKRFGGSGDDAAYSIAHTPSGNLLITGVFADTVDFGTGPINGGANRSTFLIELTP